MKSVWNNDIKRLKSDSLCGDEKTDVLIIGGGMCGLLCAYMLKNAGVDCILVEQDKILSGVTNRTTAKITFQHGLIYDKILNRYGSEKASLYYQSQKKALEKYKELAIKDDDLEECASLVYSLNNNAIIEKELDALHKIGCSAKYTKNTELPFKIAGAVKVDNQSRFNPLKFACRLADGLKIYENTKITELKPNAAVTMRGTIFAKNIIIATHFPIINKHGSYFLNMYQDRSYVIAYKNAGNFNDMYVDEASGGMSFRSYGKLSLIGGGGHRTGTKSKGWTDIEEFAKKYYPDADEVCRWATQDCMTLDGIPYIGAYSKSTSALYAATGFNKWGMTSSMVAALLLTDIICGRKSEYEDLYSPSRTILHPQLAVNMIEAAKGLLTPKTPRCPHLGCALKYNKYEHSWDCSCHGSRFDENGKVLNNPATDDKKQIVK